MDNLNPGEFGAGVLTAEELTEPHCPAQLNQPRNGTRILGEKNIALHLKLHCVAQI
jgi:hypothetical protein